MCGRNVGISFPIRAFILLLLMGLLPQNVQAQSRFHIQAIAWDASGQRYAYTTREGVLVITDLQGNEQFRFDAGLSDLYNAAVEWSPDSRLLAAGLGNQLYIWETTNWQTVGQVLVGDPSGLAYVEAFGDDVPDMVDSISWNDDASLLSVYTLSNTFSIWDISNQTMLYQSDSPLGYPFGFDFIDDHFLTNGIANFDLTTHEFTHTLQTKGPTFIESDPSGTRLAIANTSGSVDILDPFTVSIRATYSVFPDPLTVGYGTWPSTLRWDGTGNFLAVSSFNVALNDRNEIRILNVETGQVETAIEVVGEVRAMDWNPHNNLLIYAAMTEAGEETIVLVDLSSVLEGQVQPTIEITQHAYQWNLEAAVCDNGCLLRINDNGDLYGYDQRTRILSVLLNNSSLVRQYNLFPSASLQEDTYIDYQPIEGGIIMLHRDDLFRFSFATNEITPLSLQINGNLRLCDYTPVFFPTTYFHAINNHEILVCQSDSQGMHVTIIDMASEAIVQDILIGRGRFYNPGQRGIWQAVMPGQDGQIYVQNLPVDNAIFMSLFSDTEIETNAIYMAKYNLQTGIWTGLEIPETEIINNSLELIAVDEQGNMYFYTEIHSNGREIIKLDPNGLLVWHIAPDDFNEIGVAFDLLTEDTFLTRYGSSIAGASVTNIELTSIPLVTAEVD